MLASRAVKFVLVLLAAIGLPRRGRPARDEPDHRRRRRRHRARVPAQADRRRPHRRSRSASISRCARATSSSTDSGVLGYRQGRGAALDAHPHPRSARSSRDAGRPARRQPDRGLRPARSTAACAARHPPLDEGRAAPRDHRASLEQRLRDHPQDLPRGHRRQARQARRLRFRKVVQAWFDWPRVRPPSATRRPRRCAARLRRVIEQAGSRLAHPTTASTSNRCRPGPSGLAQAKTLTPARARGRYSVARAVLNVRLTPEIIRIERPRSL